MTVRVNKSAFNIREKLSELERPIGVKGNELMRAETLQDARDFISAGRRNLIINGDMQAAQRSTSSSTIIGNNYRTLDRWRIQFAGYTTVVGSTSQSSESPPGFSNSLRVNVTTAETLASSDLASIRQRVEAQDCQQFAYGTSQAKTLTLSFWIRSSVTGTYTIGLYQTDDARQVTLPYTVDNADTWEHKVITIPPDTTGVIDNDNGTGLEISWNLSAGSTYKGTDHTGWGAYANGRWANGQTADIAGTLSNLYLTGVQLEVGKNATDFEHRSYGEELALCQRYFHMIANSANHGIVAMHAYTSTAVYGVYRPPVEMRDNPILFEQDVTNGLQLYGNNAAQSINGNSIFLNTLRNKPNVVRMEVTSSISVVQGYSYWLETNTGASFVLGLDAEL